MSDYKFTPGPWKIIRISTNYDSYIDSIRVNEYDENNLMGDYMGCIIADLTKSHGNRQHAYLEVEANAKLIAAAPDMLHALLEAKRMYETIEPVGGWQFVYDSIISALKKATEI